MSRTARGTLLVVVAAACWGAFSTVAKVLFVEGAVTPQALAGIRAALAVSLLVPALLLWNPALLRIRPADLPVLAFLGIAGIAINNFFYLTTISLTAVATAVLLQYMSPILVASYAVVVERRPLTGRLLSALAAAVAGCALVVRGYDPAALRLSLPGLLTGLGAAVFFAVYTVVSQRALGRLDSWTLLTYAFGFAALFWFLLTPPWVLLAGHPPRVWGLLLLFAGLGTAVPFGLYLRGLTHVPAVTAQIVSTLEPVVAAAAAFLVLGEGLEALQLLGGGLVLGAVLLVQEVPGGTASAP
ncbi:MAG: DMT family transporter [candidate division NC10 bacterium]|nr:DMT family transporter [candidate division NC10 bacterium]